MKKINNVSSEAVEKATGKTWGQWLKIIDKAGGKKKGHKEIVAYLNKKYKLSPWWQQMVTVGYEHARGKRVTGETADAGFQLGVQRTVSLQQVGVWSLLTSQEGVNKWLGKTKTHFKEGENYKTKEGTSGEIRVVNPQEKIRMTWQPKDWDDPSTLQISLYCPRNTKKKTTVRFHHERLPNKKTRKKMKKHWSEVLDSLFSER